jgi:hypothetical protein
VTQEYVFLLSVAAAAVGWYGAFLAMWLIDRRSAPKKDGLAALPPSAPVDPAERAVPLTARRPGSLFAEALRTGESLTPGEIVRIREETARHYRQLTSPIPRHELDPGKCMTAGCRVCDPDVA